MRIVDTVSAERIRVVPSTAAAPNKATVLGMLAELLAPAARLPAPTVLHALAAREALRSTGIGEGVAIPHAGLPGLRSQIAAVVLSPAGIEFDAVDGRPSHVVFGVVGPERGGSDHLKLLARVSRLLHDPAVRHALSNAPDASQALALIVEEEERHGPGK